MKIHFSAVEEAMASMAEVREAYSPVFVPVPRTTVQPVGGVVREVARASSSAGSAKALDNEDKAKSVVNMEVRENIVKVPESTKVVVVFFWGLVVFLSISTGINFHVRCLCRAFQVQPWTAARMLNLTWSN